MSETLYFPLGFRAAGGRAGLKVSGRPDLAVIVSDVPCAAAALMTRNKFPGAPIVVSKEHLGGRGGIRGVIVNSGQANACTGREGERIARAMCEALARRIGAKPESILVSSTGVIGRTPDLGKIEAYLDPLLKSASRENWLAAAQGIMTTDTKHKISSREIVLARGQKVRILGIAKGSGMIHPNMATMLSFIATDAPIGRVLLKKMLARAADRSFHCMTVDGDTSTSDMVAVLANGAAGGPAIEAESKAAKLFEAALTEVCADLSCEIARDGEGATRLVRIHVEKAKSEAEARTCAMSIATSNLVKCALFGRDPNWGRLACAVGNSQATFEPAKVVIRIGPHCVFEQGHPAKFEEKKVSAYMSDNKELDIVVELRAGKERATVWTCDLTYDYVKINAEYRT